MFPPILVMALRHKLMNIESETKLKILMEYCITCLLFTMLCLGTVVIVFKHNGSLVTAFSDHTDFAFHYLCLATVLAISIPLIEYFFKKYVMFQFNFNDLNSSNSSHQMLYVHLLCAYSFVLGLLNFTRCFDNTLWGDEAFSVALARSNVQSMITTTANDVHPPLYYLILQLLHTILGDNGFAYHVISLLPYILILILGVTYIRKHYGIITSFIFVTMSSLMECALVCNVEIRMYSWANFFVLCAFLLFCKILEADKFRYYIFFSFFSLAAAYTHYYALVAVGLLFLILWVLILKSHKNLIKLVISSLIAILGYIPWLKILLTTFSRTSDSWWNKMIPTVKTCFLYLFDHLWMFPILIAVFVAFYLYESKTIVVETKKIDVTNKYKVSFGKPTLDTYNIVVVTSGIIVVLGITIIGLTMSYLIRPLFLERYLFPVSGIIYLIVGIAFSKMKFRKVWSVLIVLVLLTFGIKNFKTIYQSDKQLDNSTKQMVNIVDAQSNDIMITNSSHHSWTILEYYYPSVKIAAVSDCTQIVDYINNSQDAWILWATKLDDNFIQSLKEEGYEIENVSTGYIGAPNMLYAYHVKSE